MTRPISPANLAIITKDARAIYRREDLELNAEPLFNWRPTLIEKLLLISMGIASFVIWMPL